MNIIGVHSSTSNKEKNGGQYLSECFPNHYIGLEELSLSVCCHTGPEAFAVCCCVDEMT